MASIPIIQRREFYKNDYKSKEDLNNKRDEFEEEMKKKGFKRVGQDPIEEITVLNVGVRDIYEKRISPKQCH